MKTNNQTNLSLISKTEWWVKKLDVNPAEVMKFIVSGGVTGWDEMNKLKKEDTHKLKQ